MKYATLLVLTAICLAAETSERCVTPIAIPVYPRLVEPQDPDVPAGGGIDVNEGQQLPIRGTGIRSRGGLAGGQPLQSATAVGELREKT